MSGFDLTEVADVLARVRGRRPRVHCITNTVAQTFTANMLLAVGGVPSMTIAAEEIPAFVERADALLVNLGTFDAERRAAIDLALPVVRETGIPWVLDPVLIDASPHRLALARRLVAEDPAFTRANAAEFAALLDMAIDDTDEIRFAGAERFALDELKVLALTGKVDFVTDGARSVKIANGHPLMARVTAMGCAMTAVAAAFRAVEADAVVAAASALVVVGVAGEIAAQGARGPGSLPAAILDVLYTLDPGTILQEARILP